MVGKPQSGPSPSPLPPPSAPPSQISQHSYLWSPDDHPKHCLEYFPTPAPPKIDLVTNHNKIHLATPIPWSCPIQDMWYCYNHICHVMILSWVTCKHAICDDDHDQDIQDMLWFWQWLKNTWQVRPQAVRTHSLMYLIRPSQLYAWKFHVRHLWFSNDDEEEEEGEKSPWVKGSHIVLPRSDCKPPARSQSSFI